MITHHKNGMRKLIKNGKLVRQILAYRMLFLRLQMSCIIPKIAQMAPFTTSVVVPRKKDTRSKTTESGKLPPSLRIPI